jgi:hypothetical protein
MNLRNIALGLAIGVAVAGAWAIMSLQTAPRRIAYSELQRMIDRHQIVRLVVRGDDARATDKSQAIYASVVPPDQTEALCDKAHDAGAQVDIERVWPNVIAGLLQALPH